MSIEVERCPEEVERSVEDVDRSKSLGWMDVDRSL